MTTQPVSRQQRIAAYKTILRELIEQRPSGLRQKIAEVIDTHKSFVSLLTNPNDPTPLPARHVETIIDVCHLAPTERDRFLQAYRTAHPSQGELADKHHHYKTLHIQIPVLTDSKQQQALEDYSRDNVHRLSRLFSEF